MSYPHFKKDDNFIYLILDCCEETLKDLFNSQRAEYLRGHGPRIIKVIPAGLEFFFSAVDEFCTEILSLQMSWLMSKVT